MNITIDRQATISIKEQVRLELAERIRSGLLTAGTRLPSVRQLAVHLNISLVTAHQIYRSLETDRLIRSVRGKGTFVESPAGTRPADTSFSALADPYGWQLSVADYLPRASFWSQSAVRLPLNILDLSTAAIHPSLLPIDLLQASIRQSLQQYPDSLGRYAPYQGDEEFLRVMCRYLNKQGIPLKPHQLIVTNGTQQGMDLFARTFLSPGEIIAVETPCFSSAIDTFRLSHATLQPIPVDESGIRLDILEEVSTRMKLKAIYTVPTFQNPTGSIMPFKRRRELLHFAALNNILILEDDPHRELTLSSSVNGRNLPPPLVSLDEEGRVVYLKGVSKFLAPGLRLGILAASGTIYNRLLAAKSITDLGSPLWLQKSLIPLFSHPELTKHIHKLNQILAQRSRYVLDKFTRELNPRIRYTNISGGMHVWLTLPASLSADELVPVAHQQGIHFLPGSIFYPGEPETQHLRICWTNLSDEALPKALDILCRLLNQAVTKS